MEADNFFVTEAEAEHVEGDLYRDPDYDLYLAE